MMRLSREMDMLDKDIELQSNQLDAVSRSAANQTFKLDREILQLCEQLSQQQHVHHRGTSNADMAKNSIEDLLMRIEGLDKEMDSLRPGSEILSDRFKSDAGGTDLQSAKLNKEMQQQFSQVSQQKQIHYRGTSDAKTAHNAI